MTDHTVKPLDRGAKPNRAYKRAQKAQGRREAKTMDRVIEDDARRFAANPHRSFIVRPAVRVEVRDIQTAKGPAGALPDGSAWFTVVHHVRWGGRPDLRFCQFVPLPIGADVGMGEVETRALWEQGAPMGSDIDRAVRGAVARAVGASGAPTTACQCIRLPIRPGAYATEPEAVEALQRFARFLVAGAGASWGRVLVVGLGEAVYGVWRFSEPAPFAAQMQLALMLESLATRFGLHIDGPVTGNPPFDLDTLTTGTTQENAK